MPVVIEGIKEVLSGLNKIDDDMRNRLVFLTAPMMRKVASKAQGYVPGNQDVLSGWAKANSATAKFPKYDAAVARAGIGYNQGQNKTFQNGFKVFSYVYNASRPGAVYEVAGRLNPEGRAPFTFRHEGSGTYVKKSARSRALDEYKSNNAFASQQFVAALPKVTSQPRIKDIRSSGRKTKGRLLYRAWAEDSPDIYKAVIRAVNVTAELFNKKTEIKKVA
jgi:hypothetical protein